MRPCSVKFLLRSLVFVLVCTTSISLFALSSTSEEIFTNIYKNSIWGTNEQGEGFSGGGSTLSATTIYRKFLQDFLKVYAIRSVVDVGCGDWTFSKTMDWNTIEYTGIDVVKPVIEKNKILFETPSIHFIHADLTCTDLPTADLLICKDVLQHIPNEAITHFIKQLNKYRYCLITNDVTPETQSSSNPNIQFGQYRPVDLTRFPFFVKGVKILLYKSECGLKQVLLIKNLKYTP